jgi:hypothetical protein
MADDMSDIKVLCDVCIAHPMNIDLSVFRMWLNGTKGVMPCHSLTDTLTDY